MTPALVLRKLVAGYDGVAVVHGVDLHVDHGEVVALLGANGAGKTTTLLTVSGLLPALGGEIEVLGEPVRRRRRVRAADVAGLARRGVAHVSEDRALFAELTAVPVPPTPSAAPTPTPAPSASGLPAPTATPAPAPTAPAAPAAPEAERPPP